VQISQHVQLNYRRLVFTRHVKLPIIDTHRLNLSEEETFPVPVH